MLALSYDFPPSPSAIACLDRAGRSPYPIAPAPLAIAPQIPARVPPVAAIRLALLANAPVALTTAVAAPEYRPAWFALLREICASRWRRSTPIAARGPR